MREMEAERLHLEETKKVIVENLEKYGLEVSESSELVKELFIQIHDGNTELYEQAVINQGVNKHYKQQLRRNELALNTPYFGRIDLKDDSEINSTYYIGKRGIQDANKKIVVVDWRAPIASIYYENSSGKCLFQTMDSSKSVELMLKRSYTIEKGQLEGFFDSDTVVNDELLIKYLSKNTNVILSDIVSTIQEEQNVIIRATPFKNLIIQGVAGSGKTSVIIHRIAYILYNYSSRFCSKDFCIIGSNQKLANYIASGLPELDVFNVTSICMNDFWAWALGGKWKKRYTIIEVQQKSEYKTQMRFADRLEEFLHNYRIMQLGFDTLHDDKLGNLMKQESISDFVTQFSDKSVNQILVMLDQRLKERINSLGGKENKLKEYKNHYGKKAYKGNLLDIYLEFLDWFGEKDKICVDNHKKEIESIHFDLYDMAALTLIYYRIARISDLEEYEQLFIDEAQDYGIMIFYVLKTCFPKSFLNIVGDVSQNINDSLGLNEWSELKKCILLNEKEQFYYLSKSYRNTVEISDFAGNILDATGQSNYKIMPVIRHGKPVQKIDSVSVQEGIGLVEEKVKDFKEQGYESIAVICFDNKTCEYIKEKLAKREFEYLGKNTFAVLTVAESKGLEFDVVMLWKPELERIYEDYGYAKRMYVASTRALHELWIIN